MAAQSLGLVEGTVKTNYKECNKINLGSRQPMGSESVCQTREVKKPARQEASVVDSYSLLSFVTSQCNSTEEGA